MNTESTVTIGDATNLRVPIPRSDQARATPRKPHQVLVLPMRPTVRIGAWTKKSTQESVRLQLRFNFLEVIVRQQRYYV